MQNHERHLDEVPLVISEDQHGCPGDFP